MRAWRALRVGVAWSRRLRFESTQALRSPRVLQGPRRSRWWRGGAGVTTSWPGSPRALLRVSVHSFRSARRTAVRLPAAELKHSPGDEERADAVRERRSGHGGSRRPARDERGHRQAACRRSGSTDGLKAWAAIAKIDAAKIIRRRTCARISPPADLPRDAAPGPRPRRLAVPRHAGTREIIEFSVRW